MEGVISLQSRQEQARVSRDGREEVVEVVSNAPGEATDRLHPLGLPKLLREAQLFSHIQGDSADEAAFHRVDDHESVDVPLVGCSVGRGHRFQRLQPMAARKDLSIALLDPCRDLRSPALPVGGAGHLIPGDLECSLEGSINVNVCSTLVLHRCHRRAVIHESLESLLALRKLMGALLDRLLDDLVRGLELGLTPGDAAHLRNALDAGPNEKDVLERYPPRVLQPTPAARRENAVDGLGPEYPSQEVIEGDHQRRRDEDAPIPVEREKRQRSEHVEVRLDPAACEVNEER